MLLLIIHFQNISIQCRLKSAYEADLVTSLAFAYLVHLLKEMTNRISFQKQPIQKTSILSVMFRQPVNKSRLVH